MTTVVWVAEGTWPGCVDAARAWAPPEDDVLLLHVTDASVSAAAAGPLAGLLGRGRARADEEWRQRVDENLRSEAGLLLRDAAARLGRPARVEAAAGRPERIVVAAGEGAGLLVVARDGDRSRLGPHSLGRHTRFVVDHAPCPVLLVWPDAVPGLGSIPPPPPHG